MCASALSMLSEDFTVSSESLFGEASSDGSLLRKERHSLLNSESKEHAMTSS